jgi:hypothetical protein
MINPLAEKLEQCPLCKGELSQKEYDFQHCVKCGTATNFGKPPTLTTEEAGKLRENIGRHLYVKKRANLRKFVSSMRGVTLEGLVAALLDEYFLPLERIKLDAQRWTLRLKAEEAWSDYERLLSDLRQLPQPKQNYQSFEKWRRTHWKMSDEKDKAFRRWERLTTRLTKSYAKREGPAQPVEGATDSDEAASKCVR